MSVFQANCLRLVGGEYPIKLNKALKQVIKSHYGINSPITLHGKNNTRLDLEKVINEFYLFNSLCISCNNNKLNNKINSKTIYTKEEISMIFLEIVSRVIKYPKFYYTLINYNLPDKTYIKDLILSELLLMFNLVIEELELDNIIYKEFDSWYLRGYSSFIYLFKYISYLDLIILDSKEQISNSLS